MDVYHVLDLSGLDRRLGKVRMRLVGSRWEAVVRVGRVPFSGRGGTTGEALANLVSSASLWTALGERVPKEGRGSTREEREEFAKWMTLPPRGPGR